MQVKMLMQAVPGQYLNLGKEVRTGDTPKTEMKTQAPKFSKVTKEEMVENPSLYSSYKGKYR